jgi:hypothetical protein
MGGQANSNTRNFETADWIRNSKIETFTADEQHVPVSSPSLRMPQPSPTGEYPANRCVTTLYIKREQEHFSRTKQTKERLGPIVSRLKASLTKMESLEESMIRLGLHRADRIDLLSQPPSSNYDPLQFTLLPGNSRELMHGSMERVKRKLLRLKQMEERLVLSEDRRLNLQHQLLQVSLSHPILLMEATKRQNAHLQQGINRRWAEENSKNFQNGGKARQQEIVGLQQELKDSIGEREASREYLFETEAKINDQADRCDELVCPVQRTTLAPTDKVSSLKKLNHRRNGLEPEQREVRNVARQERGRLFPGTIHFQTLNEVSPIEMTLPTVGETTCRGDDDSLDSSSTTNSAFITVLPSFERGTSQKPFKLSLAGSEDDHKSMIEALIAKIEVLDRENAELSEENYHFGVKCDAQQQEIMRQTGVIRDLELRLEILRETIGAKHVLDGGTSNVVTMAMDNKLERELKVKGSLFQRFLSGTNAGMEILGNSNLKR